MEKRILNRFGPNCTLHIFTKITYLAGTKRERIQLYKRWNPFNHEFRTAGPQLLPSVAKFTKPDEIYIMDGEVEVDTPETELIAVDVALLIDIQAESAFCILWLPRAGRPFDVTIENYTNLHFNGESRNPWLLYAHLLAVGQFCSRIPIVQT